MTIETTTSHQDKPTINRTEVERQAIINAVEHVDSLNSLAMSDLRELVGHLCEWQPTHHDDFIILLYVQLYASRIYDQLELLESKLGALVSDIMNADLMSAHGLFKDKISELLEESNEKSLAQLFNRYPIYTNPGCGL